MRFDRYRSTRGQIKFMGLPLSVIIPVWRYPTVTWCSSSDSSYSTSNNKYLALFPRQCHSPDHTESLYKVRSVQNLCMHRDTLKMSLCMLSGGFWRNRRLDRTGESRYRFGRLRFVQSHCSLGLALIHACCQF